MADPRADHTSEQSGGESHGSEDLKAKMREALDRKQAHLHPDDSAAARAKAHGPEVVGGAPKMHRRKAGGGGS